MGLATLPQRSVGHRQDLLYTAKSCQVLVSCSRNSCRACVLADIGHKHRRSQMSSSQVIKLNVGGKYFTTTRSTLCKFSDSMLARMFSDSGDLAPAHKDNHGRFFIDRDGSRFTTILAFLREEAVLVPSSVNERAALSAEASYYQVLRLIVWMLGTYSFTN